MAAVLQAVQAPYLDFIFLIRLEPKWWAAVKNRISYPRLWDVAKFVINDALKKMEFDQKLFIFNPFHFSKKRVDDCNGVVVFFGFGQTVWGFGFCRLVSFCFRWKS